MKQYYRIEKSLSSFKAIPIIEERIDKGKVFEVEYNRIDNTTRGYFTCLFYLDGLRSDIAIGRWSFSGVITGSFQEPHSYTPNQSIQYELTAITPKQERINSIYYYKHNYEHMDELVESYYSLIYEVSALCSSKEDMLQLVRFKSISSNEMQWNEVENNFNTLCCIRKLIEKLSDTEIKTMLSFDWKEKFELFKQALNKMTL